MNKTRTITLGFIAIFIMGFAQNVTSKPHPNAIELKASSNFKKQPVFELSMNNTEVLEYLIKVKDENGNLLYSEKLKGKNVSRKYQLDISEEELNDAFRIQLEIVNLNTNETFTYNVIRNNRTVQDITVAKL